MFMIPAIIFIILFIIVIFLVLFWFDQIHSFIHSTKEQRDKVEKSIRNIRKYMEKSIENIKKEVCNDRLFEYRRHIGDIECVYKNYQSGYVILQAVTTKSNKFDTRRKYFAIGNSQKYIIIHHDFEPSLIAADNYKDVSAKSASENREHIAIPEKSLLGGHPLIILKSRICLRA